jgi:hypothetical protein
MLLLIERVSFLSQKFPTNRWDSNISCSRSYLFLGLVAASTRTLKAEPRRQVNVRLTN